jgi:PKHD-type hydroxylase
MFRKNDWICFEDGLDKDACDKIISMAEEKLKPADEEIYDRHIESHKDANITDIVYSEEQWIYDAIWTYMVQANEESGWKYDIRYAETFQITRYKKGMFYDWHPDGGGDHFSVHKSIGNPMLHNNVRKLSMSVLLNDDYEGGEFEIAKLDHWGSSKGVTFGNKWVDRESPGYKTNIVEGKTGSIIVFPADVWHRVKPVTKGIRYSIVIWFLGPPYV